jgi:hypothetical protein
MANVLRQFKANKFFIALLAELLPRRFSNHPFESNSLATLGAHWEYVILLKNDFMDWVMGIVNRQVHARLRHRFPWPVEFLYAHN